MKKVLDARPKQGLHDYWQRLIPLVGEPAALHICRVAAEAIQAHPGPQRDLSSIQKRWYAALEAGAPDYGVYALPLYLAEVWYCWVTYSRKYLVQLDKLGLLAGAERVLDLGCGNGYTTAALTQIAPAAAVSGTNVLDSVQGKFCQRMAEDYGFTLHAGIDSVGTADTVFASEYFEHIEEPIAHLRDVLQRVQPRTLIIANTFTSPAIGHFPSYAVDGAVLDGAATSRAFNSVLKQWGYEPAPIKMWNNRPSIWQQT